MSTSKYSVGAVGTAAATGASTANSWSQTVRSWHSSQGFRRLGAGCRDSTMKIRPKVIKEKKNQARVF
ncbi:hypothetical protein IF2G_10936 [Cordyceps javanica]|nr:hypothetical protein IF2G_10936 [Cordyceps javanica]